MFFFRTQVYDIRTRKNKINIQTYNYTVLSNIIMRTLNSVNGTEW